MAERKRKPYRVVAISLFDREADEADRCADILKRAGWPKANRSLVVREALRRLQEDLAGKDDERVFRYFVDRSANRMGSGVRPESSQRFASASPAAEASPNDATSATSTASEAQERPARQR